jgi:hypothetical protein
VERLKSGGFVKYSFGFPKASSHSLLHVNAFLRILKKGRHLSVDREMNWFRAAILPVSCYNCLMVRGGCISRTTFTFLGLASIPFCETMNPKNFPKETPKAHLDGFSFNLWSFSVLKVSLRSAIWLAAWVLFTSMSLT